MAKTIVNNLLDDISPRPVNWNALGSALSGSGPGPGGAAWRWFRCFWLLGVTALAGLTVFRPAVVDSIASTPHPALVYVIFLVAGVAAVLSGQLLATLLAEGDWFGRLRAAPTAERDALIAERAVDAPLAPLFRLVVQTRELPVGQRKQALDHEVDSAEIALMGRAALPNLLSGSLVGIGLVGTFVGLLGTLNDLSSVFSAFSTVGAATGDSATTFAGMIQKLRGPIQGMGTAFVASLYGLLGSLVIGVTGLAVRRVGDELFSAVRLHVSEELYHEGARLSEDAVEGESELSSSMRILAAVTRDEHGKLREGMAQWSQALDERLAKVAKVTATIGSEVQEAADYVGNAARRSVDSLEKARETNERLFFGMNEVSKGLIERLDTLNRELAHAGGRQQSRLVLIALGLSLFAAGAAIGAIFHQRDAQPAKPAAAVSAPAVKPAATVATSAPEASPSAAPLAAASGATVVAERGDTLSGIASRRGIPLPDLVAANPQIRNTDAVEVGQTVQLPQR